MRYVGWATMALAFWGDVVLLHAILHHRCAAPAQPVVVVAPPAAVEAAPPAGKGRSKLDGFICGLPHPHDHDRPRRADAGGGDPISKSAVVAGFNAIRPLVAACFEKYQVPGLAMVNVVIAKSGRVSSARIAGKFERTPTGACVEAAAKRASFPRSDGLSTPYPFMLK